MDWCPINFPSRVPNGMALRAFRMASPGTGDHGDRYIGSLFRVDVPFPDDYLQWLGMAAGKLHAECLFLCKKQRYFAVFSAKNRIL